ncbi:unnamed protein product, partial [marine sediment metagenome]
EEQIKNIKAEDRIILTDLTKSLRRCLTFSSSSLENA